jgi:tetratricopeptide (TPR) repeat protein
MSTLGLPGHPVLHLMRSLLRMGGPVFFRMAMAALGLAFFLNAHQTGAQSNPGSGRSSATLEVRVQDSENHPQSNVQVQLVSDSGTDLTSRTASDGTCRFSRLASGNYRIHAEAPGIGEATEVFTAGDDRKITLILRPGVGHFSNNSATVPPDFFDEPKFTAAGVTDTSNLGGHGSTTRVPTSEALSRATTSLKSDTPNPSASADSVRELRWQADSRPTDYDLNHRVGAVLLETGDANGAIPYLERAARLKTDDANTYELAEAYSHAGNYERARTTALSLLAKANTGPVHHLLATIAEKGGNPLEAAREFQRAAELDPSETNLFDWGSELLLHHAFPQATQVFEKGSKLFPKSQSIWMALATTKYAAGDDGQAAKLLCEASDLDPANSVPYEFMGRILSSGSVRSDEVSVRLARFAGLHPKNALAHYYYALSLWKEGRGQRDVIQNKKIETLLETAVRLDPKLGAAYVQLGILKADAGDTTHAISLLAKAAEVSPDLPDAHYRLSRLYSLRGEKTKAQHEFALYQQTSKAAEAALQRQRRETPQLLFTNQGKNTANPK